MAKKKKPGSTYGASHKTKRGQDMQQRQKDRRNTLGREHRADAAARKRAGLPARGSGVVRKKKS